MEYVTEQINTERLTYLSVFYLFSFFITPQNGIYMSYLLLFNKPCPPNSGLKQQLFAYNCELVLGTRLAADGSAAGLQG